MLVKRIYLAVLATAMAAGPWMSAHGQTLEPAQGYTWGINNAKAILLDGGKIITDAVLTFHNFSSDVIDTTVVETGRTTFRGGSATTTIIQTPNYESLEIYVLDNPRYGFMNLNNRSSDGDPFAGYGGRIDGVLENGNLVYRLSAANNADASAFGGPVALALSDGSSVTLSSSLLEFIDYAGTGCSVGFGMYPGQVRYYYDDITLTLTIRSYQGAYTSQTLVYQIADDMSPVSEIEQHTLDIAAVNGVVSRSPDKAVYAHGETVTLTAEPAAGYQFAGWSGDATGTGVSVTITMNGNKTVAAAFTEVPFIQTYTLSIAAANGSVTKKVNGAVVTGMVFEAGTVVELTAVPDSGYIFGGWSGSVVGTTNPVFLKINGDKTVTAGFTISRSLFR